MLSPLDSPAIRSAGPLLRTYATGLRRALLGAPAGALPDALPPGLVAEVRLPAVPRARLAAYLEVTDGADLGFEARGELPPLAFTTWHLPAYLAVLATDAVPFNLLGMVHAGNDLVVHRTAGWDGPVGCRATLSHLDRDARRLRLSVLVETWAGDTVVSESLAAIVVRLGRGEHRAPPPAPGTGPTWAPIRTLDLGADLGRRFAWVTGDVNPIHLAAWSGRLFGQRRAIAHGYCLKALVAHALLRHHPGRDLRRLALDFRAPALLPGRVAVELAGDRVRVRDLDDDRCLAEGAFALSGPV